MTTVMGIMIYLVANVLVTLVAISLVDFEKRASYKKLNTLKHPKCARATFGLFCVLAFIPVLIYCSMTK